jgi:hypothetical protein
MSESTTEEKKPSNKSGFLSKISNMKIPEIPKIPKLPKMPKISGLTNGVSNLLKSPSGYNLLDPGSMEEHLTKIGDQIIENIKKTNNLTSNEPITGNDVKAQLLIDLVQIYYEKNGVHTKKVNPYMKQKICEEWYSALTNRTRPIIQNIILLLKNHDKISKMSGGGRWDIPKMTMPTMSLPKMSLPKMSLPKPSMPNFFKRGSKEDLLENKEQLSDETQSENTQIPSDVADSADADVDATPTPAAAAVLKESKPIIKISDDAYYEEFIKYKSELFTNKMERTNIVSTTYSEVTSLHQTLISKTISNYAVIPRPDLFDKLTNIIIGNKASDVIDEYNKNKKWTPLQDDSPNIYSTFIKKLNNLGNSTTKSNDPIKIAEEDIQQDVNIKNASASNDKIMRKQYGGEGEGGEGEGDNANRKIPEYIPSTYNWYKIRKYVNSIIQLLIQNKVELNNNEIKDAFKKVFQQVNCDSLEMDEDNEYLKTYLQQQFESILLTMCENIPNILAEQILSSYMKRNFTTFAEFLKKVSFNMESNVLDYFYNYVPLLNGRYETKFLNAKNTIPKLPELNINVAQPADPSLDNAENKCCSKDKRIKDADISIEGNKENPDLDIIRGTPPEDDIEKLSEYIMSKPYINMSVFDVFKQQYLSATENKDFLGEIFGMYTSRSVKFMRLIQLQFNTKIVDTYIERYILFKHKHTTKIIAKCIKHSADIKQHLIEYYKQNTFEDPSKLNDIPMYIAQYATYLIYQVSNAKFTVNDDKEYYNQIKSNIEDPFKEPVSKMFANIQKYIIGKKYTESNYNGDLKQIFAVNHKHTSQRTRKNRK